MRDHVLTTEQEAQLKDARNMHAAGSTPADLRFMGYAEAVVQALLAEAIAESKIGKGRS